MLRSLVCALLLAVAPQAARAQEPTVTGTDSATLSNLPASPVGSEAAAQGAAEHGNAAAGPVDIITPHITDGHHLEYPCFTSPYVCEYELPHLAPVHIGSLTVDLSPTKHVVFMLLAATIAMIVLVSAGQASKKHHRMIGRPRGVAAAMEAMALYLRNEVVLPNVGHHGDKFVPFLMTLFFFILMCNLLGLIPYGSTATGNISVTLTLALITFVVVEIAGMRAQGMGYLSTIFYWNKDLPPVMRVIMFIVMSPVEALGKLTKPFALTIRLFANMTAGHIVLLALIGLIFTFKSWAIAGVPVLMAVAISILELFVSFLQAFIFTLLASVFIGQIRESHH
ncbi:MAG TPA: F0F1 ATP synthase subunit A [Gemmatimonas sp.]|nr:F0F1 ATP synthase subunit A [Gemmatimonas sp.]